MKEKLCDKTKETLRKGARVMETVLVFEIEVM